MRICLEMKERRYITSHRAWHRVTANVKDGISSYSDNYFLMEVKDSLVGMLDNDEIEEAFNVIRKIGKMEFSYQEFENEAKDGMNSVSVLSALYMEGEISNIEKDEKGNNYRVSVIRNPNSLFNERKMIAVNNGLRKALMLH